MSYEFFESVAASGLSSKTPQLIVQRSHERSSWVALPPALTTQLVQSPKAMPLVLELRPMIQRAGISLPSDSPVFVAWGGSCCSAGSIGIPAGVITGLSLVEGRVVMVRPLPDVAGAVSVTVEPASEDDWEMVELNAEYLEGNLLSQVGVVSPRQPFPFWIHSHLINLKVVSMVPPNLPAARLVPGAEVHIAPRVRVRQGASAAHGGPIFGGKGEQGQGQEGRGRGGGLAGEGQSCGEGAEAAEDPAVDTALRVLCVSHSMAAGWEAQQAQRGGKLPPSVVPVGVSPLTLSRCGLRGGDWVRLGSASSAPAPPARLAGSRFASLAPSADVAVGHIALSAQQCAAFGLPPFSHARVQRLVRAQRALVLEAAELMHRQQQQQQQQQQQGEGAPGNLAAATEDTQAASQGPALPNGGALAQHAQQGGRAEGQRAEGGGPQGWVAPSPRGGGGGGDAEVDLEGLSWLGESLEKAVQVVLPVLGDVPRAVLQSWGMPPPGGLLVSGPAGSGKSALLAATAAVVQRHPHCLAHPVVIRCGEITLEGSLQMQAIISAKVQEALDHMPSLLVFDDMDMLCRAEADGPDGAGAKTDPGLAAWLCDVIDYLQTPSQEWGTLPLPPVEAAAPGGLRAAAAVPAQREEVSPDGKVAGGGLQRGEPSPSQQIGASVGKSVGADEGGSSGGGFRDCSANRSEKQGDVARGSSDDPSTSGMVPPPSFTYLWPPVALAASCKDPAALAAPLRAAGRLDHPLSLPAPSADSRAAILAAGVRARGSTASPTHLQAVAEQADGFDAADLEVLLDRALHLAFKRGVTSSHPPRGHFCPHPHPGCQLH